VPLPRVSRRDVDTDVRWVLKSVLAGAALCWLIAAVAAYDWRVNHNPSAVNGVIGGVGMAFFLTGLGAVLYIVLRWPVGGDRG